MISLCHSLGAYATLRAAEETCERDMEKLRQHERKINKHVRTLVDLEEKKAVLESQLENIDSLPELKKDRDAIEELKKKLRMMEEHLKTKMENEQRAAQE